MNTLFILQPWKCPVLMISYYGKVNGSAFLVLSDNDCDLRLT